MLHFSSKQFWNLSTGIREIRAFAIENCDIYNVYFWDFDGARIEFLEILYWFYDQIQSEIHRPQSKDKRSQFKDSSRRFLSIFSQTLYTDFTTKLYRPSPLFLNFLHWFYDQIVSITPFPKLFVLILRPNCIDSPLPKHFVLILRPNCIDSTSS